MPLLRKNTLPSSEPKPRSLRTYLTQKIRSAVPNRDPSTNSNLNSKLNSRQRSLAPEPDSTPLSYSHPTTRTPTKREPQPQPQHPRNRDDAIINSPTTITNHFNTQANPALRTPEPENQSTTTTLTTTIISSTESTLPSYDDVSGAVIVDAYGNPHFLTPQEERERQDTLQRAVHERMLGLPRRTEFSWEASGGPVLPRYEAGAQGAVSGVGIGGGCGVNRGKGPGDGASGGKGGFTP
ncbi:hypothetical protein BDW59DRAFT_166802 [Aspergillus cavernicola]|uniref:Uncharacterized protein n=1 Tax=Aspergillus cavernicola TaxID=176166 RepID=A0ABR4HKX4_9EURO